MKVFGIKFCNQAVPLNLQRWTPVRLIDTQLVAGISSVCTSSARALACGCPFDRGFFLVQFRAWGQALSRVRLRLALGGRQLADQAGCFGDQVAFRARWPVKIKAKPAPGAVLRKVRPRPAWAWRQHAGTWRASRFLLEFLPPIAYHPAMANTSTSSMDQLVASGVDPKTAEALKKLVEDAIEVADRSRPREAVRRPALQESIGWTGIIAIAAVISIQLGAIYWLNNSMRAGFESVSEEFGRVREEFGRVRNEISDLRNHTLAEIGSIRSEVGKLDERMIGYEMLIQDWMSSVTAKLAE